MILSETLRMAVDSFRANKVRFALTALALGFQVVLSSFFVSLLQLRR